MLYRNVSALNTQEFGGTKIYYNYEGSHVHDYDYDNMEVIKPATCTEEGEAKIICRKCGDEAYESIDPKGHNFTGWSILVQPTTSKTGERERACLDCGLIESEVLPKLSQTETNETFSTDKPQTPSTDKPQTPSADKPRDKVVKTKKIKGVPKKLTLKRKKSKTLKPVLTPKNSTQKITFKSSNKKVATVNAKGKITAKKKGTAVITVKSGKITAKCKVKVK